MKQNRFIFASLLIIAAISAACSINSTLQPTQVSSNDLMFTQAAQTVVVQLTANASVDTATAQAGGQSQIPAVTATPEVVLPTGTETMPIPVSSPTQSVTPSDTPSPTPTQNPPTPTLSGEDIVKSLGSATWTDNFDNGDNWSFSKDDRISMEAKDGNAVLIAHNPDYYYGWTVSWPTLTNFYLEITVKTGAECAGQDKYGLIFRSPDPSEGYLLGFSCDGRFRVWYFTGKKEDIIQDWQTSSNILSGPQQTNRLGIKAVGNKYTVYANGIGVYSFLDDRHSEGKFGIMVGSVKTTDFTVYVDKISYWDLK